MSKAKIYYHDIGDYLGREEKLAIVKKFGSIANPEMNWKVLQPNEHGDWISQRNDVFDTFIPVNSDRKFDFRAKSFFVVNSRGNEAGRDAWVYNSSANTVKKNMNLMVQFYNEQVSTFSKEKESKSDLKATTFIDTNKDKISWSSSLISHLENGSSAIFEPNKLVTSLYRPYFKQHLYLGDKMIHRRGQFEEFFPTPKISNLVICISGVGGSKDFSIIISDLVADVQLQFNGQCFPLYYYEERKKQSPTLFDAGGDSEYIQRDGVSDFILERAKKQYGKNVSKEDIFYYVYGILHSPAYRTAFANDLKKMLPRLPLVDDVRDFWAFSKAGRRLADLHINYEKVHEHPNVLVNYLGKTNFNPLTADSNYYRVEKMRFPKKDKKDIILYNSRITLSNIPEKAYEYVVNGKSAIEWIMERYQIITHKDSGIRNDPNDWAVEVGNPRYILDLLLSVINVSVQTVNIVEGLPEVKF